MKNRIRFILNLILVWFFLSFGPSCASGEDIALEFDDILPLKLFKIEKPGPSVNYRLIKEVKLVAGPDQKWFSADDEVYTYYVYKYDDSGRIAKEYAYKIGPDNVAYTADDELFHYVSFVYDQNNLPIREIARDGKGPDDKWFTQDDAEDYQFIYQYNLFGEKTQAIGYTSRVGQERCITYEYFFGKIIKDVEYRQKGTDGRWCTTDDRIEKYHKFEYNLQGNLTNSFEYNNKGKDKIWFTRDDTLNAYTNKLYNMDNSVSKNIKYNCKGPDNKWFTFDDQIQYYILYYYSQLP